MGADLPTRADIVVGMDQASDNATNENNPKFPVKMLKHSQNISNYTISLQRKIIT